MSGSITATRFPGPPSQNGRQQLRLTLKPEANPSGYVDGGWWPRFRDLGAELPALMAALAARLGRVERVSYNLTTWGAVDRKIEVGGSVVRLAGYRSQHPDTVDVITAQHLITLLVVPPETSAELANRALMAAADPGNTDAVKDLLAPHPPSRNP
jgi:Family of unknown function (DUF5994)